MARKEYELTHAILRYAAACTHEGDWPALRDMGFGDRETEALRSLTLGEIALLEHKLDGHVLHVQLDRTAFWMVINQIRRETEYHRIKTELVRRNAPAEMMEALFGMGAKEYAATRRAIRAPRGVGRPPEADEETARRIWLAWERLGSDPTLLRPTDWLQLAEETGACLRVIWRLVQRWTEAPPTACTAGSGGRRSGVARLGS